MGECEMAECEGLVKLEEAAELTNISKHCIKYLIRRGMVKGTVDGDQIFVDVVQVRQYKDLIDESE